MPGFNATNTCATCLYWDKGDGKAPTGRCRHDPPRPGGQDSHWPLTLASDWCGGYQPGVVPPPKPGG